MSSPLLATKLYIPPLTPNIVPRSALIRQLDDGLRAGLRLTLVCAPAGFGKTTLVADWLNSAKRPSSWLLIDESDNDPVRFAAYLLAALQKVDSRIGQAARAMLQAPQPSRSEPLLTALINDITTTSRPFTLVLDDYHTIRTPAIHEQLTFLVEHQPPQMHVVIASREDPPMPLSRWRGRGHMVDIRQADLRFTEEETADFLQRAMGLEVSSADIVALQQRTEGWIAGLQLAALSMQESDDVHGFVQSFSGSNRYVLDYLIDEVFRQQSREIQDFLVRTSVLDRLSAPLCDAVLQRHDGADVLLALEHGNLFVVPLDESRQWYRYHRLFRDLLRHRLESIEVRDTLPLHKRASEWFEANGFLADSVHHALAGSDWERAAPLVLEASDSMLKRGELVTLLRWLEALPDEVVRLNPQLCLTSGWALVLTGQLEAGESYLAQAEKTAQDDANLLGAVMAAQAFIARSRGNDSRTVELSRRALSLLPEGDWSGRSIVAVNLGIALWSGGHLREAEQALTEAHSAAQRSGNHYAGLTALGFLGVVRGAQGRLHQGADLFRQAIGSGEGSPAIALAYNELSALFYEWDELEDAAEHLQRGIELGRRGGNVEVQIGGYRTLARLKQAQGDPSAALEALEAAHRLARDRDVPPLMRARNAACHVQIALAQGDASTAARWAQQTTEGADACAFYPLLDLTPGRLLLAQSHKARAAARLEAEYDRAARAGWRYGAVEVRALQALAAPTSDEALAFLADALPAALPEGYIRTFVDKGEPMAACLRQAASQGIERDYVAQLLAAFDPAEQRRTRSGKPALPAAPRSRRSPGQVLVEPLSERETQILWLLAEGHTYREMAKTLYVSVNTIKTHLKSIYGKLGVHNRRQAATKAAELDLLP